MINRFDKYTAISHKNDKRKSVNALLRSNIYFSMFRLTSSCKILIQVNAKCHFLYGVCVAYLKFKAQEVKADDNFNIFHILNMLLNPRIEYYSNIFLTHNFKNKITVFELYCLVNLGIIIILKLNYNFFSPYHWLHLDHNNYITLQ